MNRKQVIWALSAGGVALLLGAEVYLYFQVRSLRRNAKDLQGQVERLQWWAVEEVMLSNYDEVDINVGIVQFLRKGYSIELERANYTADGLNLRGYVGNPTNLWISTLTLNFEVGKPLVQYEADFLAAVRSGRGANFREIFKPIGSSQSSMVASLGPGTSEPFEVTVPNVKQTKEKVRLTVWFSGERYSYRLP
jgi:hypothetical protein